MAQDPEGQDDRRESGEPNLSHDFDMVQLFQSQAVDAELDADNIRGVLEANNIPSVVAANELYPNLGVEIKVARADLDRARAVVAEALAAGPDAAAEAEAESETPQ